MDIASFIYTYTVVAGDTRETVILDIDFNTVQAANPNSKIILEALLMSGMRQNVSGAAELTESFSGRLIGNFNSNTTVVASIVVPRAGDRIARFRGIAFSTTSPFYSQGEFADIAIPSTFQLEFIPSNRSGSTTDDQLTLFFSIVYRIGSI